MWLDGKLQPDVHVEFIRRAVAFCLKNRGKLSTQQWNEIVRPFPTPRVSLPNPPPASNDPLALPAGAPAKRVVRWTLVSDLSDEEKVLLASAQGLIHQRTDEEAPSVFLANRNPSAWLEQLAKGRRIAKIQVATARDVIGMVGHRRAVVVDPDLRGSLNLATMVAGIEGLLVAWPEHVSKYALEPTLDLRGTFESATEMLEFALAHLRPNLATVLADVPPDASTWAVRDYLVQHRVFTYNVPSPGTDALVEVEGRLHELTRGLLASAPLHTTVLGFESSRPWSTEFLAARYAKRWVSIAGMPNLGFIGRLPRNGKPAPRPAKKTHALDSTKVYLAVLGPEVERRAIVDVERFASLPGARSSGGGNIPPDMEQAIREVIGRRQRTSADETGPVGMALALDADALLGPYVDEYLERAGIARPHGRSLPSSLTPGGYASVLGAGRIAAVEGLFAALGKAMAGRDVRWLQMPPAENFGERGLEVAFAQLPAGTAVFVEYDSARAGDFDPLTATRLAGGAAVFHDLGSAQLTELLTTDGLKTYGRALPLFLFTDASTLTRMTREDPLPDAVVRVTPEELTRLAIEFHSQRKLEKRELVAAGSTWRYHDRGTEPGKGWTKPGFKDTGWRRGSAEFGYGDADEGRPETTVLSFGDDAQSKHIAYYFRRTFEAGNSANLDLILLEGVIDDGCVAYLNGEEIWRFNMSDGEIGPTTRASTAYGGAIEAAWRRHLIPPRKLRSGKNTIAVEVHQSSASSSDMSFDMRVNGYRWAKRQQ